MSSMKVVQILRQICSKQRVLLCLRITADAGLILSQQIPMLLDEPPSYSLDDPCRNYVLDPFLDDASEWVQDPFPNLRPANEDAARK